MKCERCKIEKEQIKAGKTKAGSQKYKCKVYGKVFTPKLKERNYSDEVESVGFMNTEQIYGLCKDGLFVHTLNYCFEKVFGL